MKKRLFSILLVLALLCSLLPQAAFSARAEGAPVFEDVPEDAYYKDAVDWAIEKGITSGTSPTTFSPKKICTRGEIMTFLWAAAGHPTVEVENPFEDVKEGKFYYNAVLWAYATEITSGTTPTTFSPKKECTRAEAVTFLWIYASRPIVEIENPFEDVSESKYYYHAVLWAYANGITSGTSETTFGPKEPCTRAHIITFLYKALAEAETPDERLNEYGLAKIVEDGAILHAWCWNFNTIKAMIPQIAAAGFSAVQTSPINSIIVGENGGLQIVGQGKWYYHYQPTEYEVIGNYQLGTDEEFRQMCEVAHSYGVKVIVDQVVNHMTATESAISNKIRNEIDWGEPGEWGNPSKPWTHKSTGTNWSERDRFEETQNSLSGLIEWNTQNPNVQQYILRWLQTCVEAGADGFRYDAAKLIELPDDVSIYHPDYNFASDFWPTVLQNGASFQYGEALQEGEPNHRWQDVPNVVSGYNDEDSSRLHAYQAQTFLTKDGEEKHFNTTLSFYGWRLRDAVHHGNLNAAYVGDMLVPEGASADRTVTWVESHDNYINDHSYNELDEQQVIQAWAILAARKEGTPLFFSRPMNATASSPYGNNQIGPEGSHFFMDSQVVAVNFFRNEMGSAEEYLSNPTGTDDIVMIERGDKGAVIVNVRNEDIVLEDAPVQSMADGSYTDQVYGGTFTVSGGKISGTLRAGKVAVVYNSKLQGRLDFEPEITLSVPSSEFITDTLEVTISMRGVASASYTVNDGEPAEAVNGTIVTIGEGMENDDTATLVVTGFNDAGEQVAQVSAAYTKRGYRGDTMVFVEDQVRINRGWGDATVYIYLWGGNGTNNGSWPGVAAELQTEGKWAGYWKYVLPFELENEAEMHVIVNNGSGGGNNQIERGDMLIHPGEIKVMNADEEWEDGSGDYHKHEWDEGVRTAEPSCTEDGSILYTCAICGNTKAVAIPALGHDWNEGEQTLEPSCTADGAYTYTCLRCGETRDDPIDALGHDYGEDGVCLRCGETDPGEGRIGFVQTTRKPAAEDQVIIAVETEDGFFAFEPKDHNRNPATGIPITVEDRVVVDPDPALVWTVDEGTSGSYNGLVFRFGGNNLRFNSNRIRLQNNLGNGIYAAVNYGDAFKLRNEALGTFLGYADGAYVIASEAYPVYFFTWKGAPDSEPSIFAAPGTSTFDNTLDLVLHYNPLVDHAAYQLGEGPETAFADGDVITVGEDMAPGETVVLKLTGYDAEDAVIVTEEFSYTKRAPLGETTVYVEDGYQGWDAYAVHAWNAPTDELSEGQITTAWPGIVSELQTEGDWAGYWKSVLPGEFAGLELIKIIINNNGNGSQQDAGTMAWGETKVMTKDGEWLSPEELPTEPELPNNPDPEGPLT